MHRRITYEAAMEAGCSARANELATEAVGVDFRQDSQKPDHHVYWHHMAKPGQSRADAEAGFNSLVQEKSHSCYMKDVALLLHAWQDSFSPAHREFQQWHGFDDTSLLALAIHGLEDSIASVGTFNDAKANSRQIILDLMRRCPHFCDGCTK